MEFRHFRKLYGRALLVAVLALYLPPLATVWQTIQWSRDQLFLWMVPFVPGWLPAAILEAIARNSFRIALPFAVGLLISSLCALLLIAVLTVIGARGRGWLIVAFAFGLGYGIITALALRAAFQV